MRTDIHRFRRSFFAALGIGAAPACYGGDAPSTLVDDGSSQQGSDASPSSTASGDPGGGSSGEGGSSAAGSDGGEPSGFDCLDPQPVLQTGTGEPSGFVRCSDGIVHRVEVVPSTDPTSHDSPCVDPGEAPGCLANSDCTLDPYGMCLQRNDVSPSHDPQAYCFCDYGCRSDDDCGLPGYICAPFGVVVERGRCIPSNCASDDQCDSRMCAMTFPLPEDVCFGTPPFEGGELVCMTGEDECRLDEECAPDPDADYVRCQGLVSFGRRQCNSLVCTDPGRPFTVEGEPRVAGSRRRPDWIVSEASPASASSPRLADLDASMKRELAAYWRRVGQLEHAAVASFARFSLQLLSVGAPADLVLASQQAGEDEVVHAQLAFSLASAYAGSPIGPGPLSSRGATEDMSWATILAQVVREACIGETLAALEAEEAARWAEDPSVHAALRRIADDEFRHAVLGWRFLSWVVARGDSTCGEQVRRELEAGLREVSTGTLTRRQARVATRCHGVIDGAQRREIHREAHVSFLAPMVTQLLASAPVALSA
ncbi:MAG: hypothetical protein V3V08_13215 [Nannocystaceae bacterium]